MSAVHEPPVRPEYIAPQRAAPAPSLGSTGPANRLDWLNKPAILLALVILWELLARWVDNDLLLPGALQTARAFIDGIASGELIGYVTVSLAILVQGFLLGVAIAFLLTWLAVSNRFGHELIDTLTSMFNPLPAIALLPLALLWFGLGKGSLLMVLVHSVVWPLTLNASAGFRAVPETLRMAGRNYGLGGLRMAADPGAGGAAVDPVGPEDRLGLCLAHADRGGAGLWQHVGAGRPGLVHLPEPQ